MKFLFLHDYLPFAFISQPKLYNHFISNVKYNLSLFYVKYHFFLPCREKRYLTYVGENPVFVIFADDLNYDQ